MKQEPGRPDLPEEQAGAMRKAIRIEWLTLAYACVTIAVVALVLGNSQSMKTAWIEDIVSTVPQIAFLVAVLFVRRKATRKFPYGTHRSIGIGHLVGGVALLFVGGSLAFESASGLLAGEHPSIGTVVLFGHTVWLGWIMMAVMAPIAVLPLVYFGPQKKKLAKQLHNKLLFADGDMAAADWTTNAASIVGVFGVGIGWWWLDGAAAIFISLGIIWDGVKNTKTAVVDLMDHRATTHDGSEEDPVIDLVEEALISLPWVAAVACRVRDQGQVFHVEAFVVPREPTVSVTTLDEAAREVAEVDWKLQEVAIIPVPDLPEDFTSPQDRRSKR